VQTATVDHLVGRLLEGRYRILDRIAQGGMSTVYSAIDERLDRRVAVKVMSSALSADPKFSDRFAREARAAARLSHVNAVAVYDQGVDSSDGHHVFLVMELVQGRTLRDLIRERSATGGRFSPAEAISILEPVLSALSAAHRAGLVHRDVKPENILLSDDGLVKVADFGLARAIDADAASTRTGLMMGTVAYCAPEQLAGGYSDQRCDVYAAGIVLFELLTGQPPYQGASAMNVAYQHVHSRVPAPSSRVKGIPTPIDEIVVAAADRDPDGRPADASALLAEIADARAELGLPVVPIPPRTRAANGARRPGGRGVGPVGTVGPGGTASDVSTALISGRPRSDTATVGPHGTGRAPRTEAPPPVVIPPPKQPRTRSPKARRRRRRIIALVAVLVLGLLSVTGGMVGVRLYREWNTHVPKVAGATVRAATAELRRTGYTVDGSVTSEFSETVPAGQVIRTVPTVGQRLTQGKTVRLVVSLGQDRVPVPDVGGQPLTDAEKAMQDHGLQFDPSPRTRHSIRVQQGQVITTIPPAGSEIRRDKQIVFVVSSGPPIRAVPHIDDSTSYDAARQQLRKAGFRVSRVDEFSDSVDEGNVISLDPSDRATYGSIITVTVSRGPEFVTVPDFDRLEPLDDYEQALHAVGLHAEVQKAFGGDNNLVISVDPGPGTEVHPGDTVTVTVI
jgi:serine/threonine protein kinase/beta-lactam-binding protein with PASTA domain